MFLAWRNEDDVPLLDRDLAALRTGRPLPRQHIDAFLEALMEMRTARAVGGLRHRDFGDAEGHPRSDLARHRLERAAAGQPEPLGFRLLQQPRHQPACLSSRISAVPPCTASSWRKMAAASAAIAAAISASMRRPLSAVACWGLPNHPVGAIE